MLGARQVAADNELRKSIILDAFSYKHAESDKILGQNQPLQPDVLHSFMNKQKSIEKAAGSLGVPVEQVQQRLNDFFERMNRVVGDMSTPNQSHKQGRNHKHGRQLTAEVPGRREIAALEWLINKPQVDRIWELFRLMEDYVTKRDQFLKPIENFLRLVNGFLTQTGKRIALDSRNYLNVLVDGSEERRAITTLSSGERQILVMLAHLSLNERLMDKGVFIVDEPELSLHIAWQEMFVDAIHEASPETQIVLATHSPAIILDRDMHCKDITRGMHA